jgi:hypothetical protein
MMESLIESTFFYFAQPPNLRLKRPSWMQMPSSMQLFGLIIASYFLVTGGVIYDVINEPPSVGKQIDKLVETFIFHAGSTTDERGNSRPVAIMQYRVNGQYIMVCVCL